MIVKKKTIDQIRVEVLERRNYLKSLDIPKTYSKVNLYGGVSTRVRRKEDITFGKKVKKQLRKIDKFVGYIDSYKGDLNTYNISLAQSSEGNPNPLPLPVPIEPTITLPPAPNGMRARRMRRFAKGINQRRFR